jgi:hypothetical protein
VTKKNQLFFLKFEEYFFKQGIIHLFLKFLKFYSHLCEKRLTFHRPIDNRWDGIAGEGAGPGGVAKMERVVAAAKQTCLYDAGTSIVVFASELERCSSHRRHHEQGKAHEDGQCCSHRRKGQR